MAFTVGTGGSDAAANSLGADGLTVTWDGDPPPNGAIIVIGVHTDANGATLTAPYVGGGGTTDAGFTTIVGNLSGTEDGTDGAWWKIANDEPASYRIVSSNAGQNDMCGIVQYWTADGVIAASLDDSDQAHSDAFGTSKSAPEITVSSTGDAQLAVAIFSASNGNTVATPPSGFSDSGEGVVIVDTTAESIVMYYHTTPTPGALTATIVWGSGCFGGQVALTTNHAAAAAGASVGALYRAQPRGPERVNRGMALRQSIRKRFVNGWTPNLIPSPVPVGA